MNTAFQSLRPLGEGTFHVALLASLSDGTEVVYRKPNDFAAITGLDGLRTELELHLWLQGLNAPVVPVIEADLETCEELDAFAEPVVDGNESEAVALIHYILSLATMLPDKDMRDHLEFLAEDAVHDGDVHWNQFGIVGGHLVLLDI